MSTRPSKLKGLRKTKKDKHREEETSQAFASSDLAAQEFRALLEEVDFVSRVVDIYRRHELRELAHFREHGIGPSRPRFEQTFQRQEDFIKKYLPDRLYQATDTLVIEAVLAAIGRPMRRLIVADLYNSIFVRRNDTAPPLRGGRDEIWDSLSLKWAIANALPEIKNPRNVTLSALAKRINNLPRKGMLRNMRKNLTGKHLQKLLNENHIDWMRIKTEYKRHLAKKSV